MFNKIVEKGKEIGKAITLKKVLVVGGIITGLAVAGAVVFSRKNDDDEVIDDNEIPDEATEVEGTDENVETTEE